MNCSVAATWMLTGGAAGAPVETRKYLGLLQVSDGVALHSSVRSQLSAPLGWNGRRSGSAPYHCGWGLAMAGDLAASWWPAGRLLSPVCLQEIWTVHIGGQPFVLFNLRWFQDCRVDEAWGRLERVRVRDSSVFEQQAALVEATRVDAQFWLTDIPSPGAQLQACTLPPAKRCRSTCTGSGECRP